MRKPVAKLLNSVAVINGASHEKFNSSNKDYFKIKNIL